MLNRTLLTVPAFIIATGESTRERAAHGPCSGIKESQLVIGTGKCTVIPVTFGKNSF